MPPVVLTVRLKEVDRRRGRSRKVVLTVLYDDFSKVIFKRNIDNDKQIVEN